ncbi:MAG: XRE family transcriptional regulator [Bacteroidetes bacterium HGW-Bacteroidetes-17]|jgi:transcriptional regulator with XRE-family HTH domain|nr:MAG: XRE family transcriptional regulator [Bacteroidetes bacterium HGW-Bacteroidetes-17]
MIIGKKLRELREQKGLLLRQVAASLEVDTAYISKMERGEKNIKREFILKLAELYQTDKNQLITIWLADQVYDILKDETLAESALNIVKEHIQKRK